MCFHTLKTGYIFIFTNIQSMICIPGNGMKVFVPFLTISLHIEEKKKNLLLIGSAQMNSKYDFVLKALRWKVLEQSVLDRGWKQIYSGTSMRIILKNV